MRSNFWGILIVCFICNGNLYSDIPNSRVFPSGNLQVETSIATHPANPMIMAGSAITDVYPGGYTTGAYVTTNGGVSWNGTNSIKTAQNNIITTIGDPTITIDKDGVIIIPFIAPSPIQGQQDFRVGVSRSTNNGTSWSSTYYVPGVDSADKISCTTDGFQASPYFGRSYIVYSEKRGVYISYTTNNGQTWSLTGRVSPGAGNRRVGASVVTGPSGEIYVSWPYTTGSYKYIGFAKSTDGGVNWITNDLVIPAYPSPYDFRFNLNQVKLNGLPVLAIDKSGGPYHGKLYIVCSQGLDPMSPSLDDYDLTLYTSVNGGATWSGGSLVNQSSAGSTSHQFFPNIQVDNNGGVNIVYYDNRNTPTNDSTEIFISRSKDGGNTFNDILLSDHKFKLTQLSASERLFGNPPYIGSYIGISCSGNKVHALWFDNSTGKYQAWHSSIQTVPEVSIRIIPEGLYSIFSHRLNRCDSVKMYLRSSTIPYQIIDYSESKIDSINFSGSFTFPNTLTGQYYIYAVHKNSISVWSNGPVTYSSSTGMSFDFTDSQSKAYGNNLILMNSNPLHYGMFSGDVDRDGLVDISDMSMIEIDLLNYSSGYFLTDLNGDYIVDNSDNSIADNNILNQAYIISP